MVPGGVHHDIRCDPLALEDISAVASPKREIEKQRAVPAGASVRQQPKPIPASPQNLFQIVIEANLAK